MKTDLSKGEMGLRLGELLLLAIGVAMDGMTAAIAVGLTAAYGHKKWRVALCFALSHLLFPLAGWLTVDRFFALLTRIGGPLIGVILMLLAFSRLWSAFRYHREEGGAAHLLLTAFATGLDATTVGVAMALSPPLVGAVTGCVLTAVVTFLLCLFGVTVGHRAGTRLGRSALFGGGLLLLILALRAFFC